MLNFIHEVESETESVANTIFGSCLYGFCEINTSYFVSDNPFLIEYFKIGSVYRQIDHKRKHYRSNKRDTFLILDKAYLKVRFSEHKTQQKIGSKGERDIMKVKNVHQRKL